MHVIIHRLNDEYITVVFSLDPCFVLHKNANSDTLWVSLDPCLISHYSELIAEHFASRIDVVLETGSTRPLVKSAKVYSAGSTRPV